MCGLRRLALTPCVGEPRTALRVTSDPVPAVVGTQTHGSDGRASGRPSPIDLEIAQRIAAVGDERRGGLAEVERRPAADRDDHLDVGKLEGRRPTRVVDRRLAVDPDVVRRVDRDRRSAAAGDEQRAPPGSSVAGRSRTRPAPKTMRDAVANSKPARPLTAGSQRPQRVSGKTARYFVLERGSAISGATASRQAA